jgi:hypothetical protein
MKSMALASMIDWAIYICLLVFTIHCFLYQARSIGLFASYHLNTKKGGDCNLLPWCLNKNITQSFVVFFPSWPTLAFG